jgi:predicted  nucleic acid-binding Zn-ribbon protein
MWTKTRLLNILLISAFLCLSLPCVGICSENQTYTISETELTTLQNHLNALEQNNETLKAILSESNEDLTIALDALMKSQNELATLKAQLQQAKNDAESARNSLQIANEELAKAAQSFKAYEKERDKVEGRLRNQRNIWEVLCLVAVGVAVAR